MVKRIEVYSSFKESEEDSINSNLKLSYWERWIKGIELSEFALRCARAHKHHNLLKSDANQFNLYLPKSKE